MISSYRTTSNTRPSVAKTAGMPFTLALVSVIMSACASTTTSETRASSGVISYPFVAETRPLGQTRTKQPFVIRSTVGTSEYSVEIPDSAADYDIQIPLADIAPKGSGDLSPLSLGSDKSVNPGTTDKELVAALPDLAKNKPGQTAMMDAAFGVGSPEGPVQSPSYTLGIARVNQHFKNRNYELALVELNNVLAYYPNSPKLLKMKGTLLLKTGNHELAMRSWQRALDLAPQDLALQNSMNRLNERLIAEQNARAASGAKQNSSSTITPMTPIAPTPDQALDSVAH